jgi:putative aldouronate transport system substrate-binding protein
MKSVTLSRRRFLQGAGASAAVLLSACAQPAPAPAPAAPTQAPAQPAKAEPTKAPPPPARVKINYGLFVMSAQDPAADADSLIQKTLQDRFNVDFNFIWIERFQAKDVYATRFAAGDIPDVFHYEQTGQPLIEQGIVAEVPIGVYKKFMPKYFKALNDYSIMAWLGANYKGKNYGLPLMGPNNLIPFTEGWRLDSLEKIGMTKAPETLVEMEDAMTKAVAQKLHQYGVISRAKDAPQMMFANVFGAYGVFPLHWMERADKSGVDHGITLDGAKEALTTLANWYKKGLIHPEFVTSGWQQCVNAWCQGKTIVTDVGTWYRLYKGGELFDCIVDAGGKIALAYAPKGPKGDFGYHGWGYANPPIRFGKQMVGDNPRIAKMMEVWDVASSDKDLAYFIRYGKEGEHSARDEWGVPQIKKEVDRAKLGTSIGILTPSNIEVWKTFQRKDYDDITKYARAGTTNKNYVRDLGVFMNPDITKVGPDLQLIQAKWEVDFIAGNKGLDKWGDFIKEYMEKGGQAMKDEANRAYKTMSGDLDTIKKAIASA